MVMSCKFCEDKELFCDDYGSVRYYDDHLPKIVFDNSGNEYQWGEILINYCPICGKKLVDSEVK